MQSLSLTRVSVILSLKLGNHKQDSKASLTMSSRATDGPSPSLYTTEGLGSIRKDNGLTLSVLKRRLCLEPWRLSLRHALAKLFHSELG